MAARPRAEAAPLLEREVELEIIERSLDDLRDGVGSMLLVEGPAGIGKTGLLSEATDRARTRGLLVRYVRAGELEREMPFGLARLLVEPLLERYSAGERARVLAGSAELAMIALGREHVGHGDSGIPDRFAPLHGLYWFIANVAETQPMLLVLDDAQWIDPETLRWLDYMARRLGDVPVAMMVGIRLGDPNQPHGLAALRNEAKSLHLEPLSPEGVRAVIADKLSEPTPKFAEACVEVTAGNPFLLTEILRTLRADHVEPGEDAARSLTTLGSQRVAEYVLVRLARFGPDAVTLARTISVLGAAPQLRSVAALTKLEESEAQRLCDLLRDAELLAPGHPIEFVHPLVRSAIYDEQAEGERVSLHRRAAEHLDAAGAESDQVAAHLMMCPANGDEWVVERLRDAAIDAFAVGALTSATRYLERALEEPAAEPSTLLHQLGVALRSVEPARAPEVLAQAADHTSDPSARMEALKEAAAASLSIGDLGQARQGLAMLLEGLSDGISEERLWAESHLFCFSSVGTEPAEMSPAIRTGARGGENPASRGALFARVALGWEGFIACDPVDEVLELADSFPPLPWDATEGVQVFGWLMLAWSGRWNEARAVVEPALAAHRKAGRLLEVSAYSGFLAEIDRLAGRLDDAVSEARTALELADELAPFSLPGWGAITNLLATLVAKGELKEAEEVANRVPYWPRPKEVPSTPFALESRGFLRLERGELEAGADDFLTVGEDLTDMGLLNPAASPWRQEAAATLGALDRTHDALELVTEGEALAQRYGALNAIGTMLRARAMLEPRARQISTLLESVAALEICGAPHELARSLVELGAAQRRAGNRSESREPLRRGLELARQSGAKGLETHAREELAAAGSRPRSVFRTGVDALTASELRVAKLAAEGLSNVEIAQRLFVSRKTVEKHLGNVYMKLEIAGRGEIAGILSAEHPSEPNSRLTT